MVDKDREGGVVVGVKQSFCVDEAQKKMSGKKLVKHSLQRQKAEWKCVVQAASSRMHNTHRIITTLGSSQHFEGVTGACRSQAFEDNRASV